jgi:ribosomal-protein-alanine N-acetyltransferase
MPSLVLHDPAQLLEAAARSAYEQGGAAVCLAKAAATPTKAHALAGRVYLSGSGWLLLSVPNALVRGAFDALDEPGAELPVNGEGKLEAHVTLMSPDEVAKVGGPAKISERGHTLRYTLGAVKEVVPAGQPEHARVWYAEVDSPAIRALRKSYGLEPYRKGYDHHITIAVRKRKVLQDNEVTKAANEQAEAVRYGLDRDSLLGFRVPPSTQAQRAQDLAGIAAGLVGQGAAGGQTGSLPAIAQAGAAETGARPFVEPDPLRRLWRFLGQAGSPADELGLGYFAARPRPDHADRVARAFAAPDPAQGPVWVHGTRHHPGDEYVHSLFPAGGARGAAGTLGRLLGSAAPAREDATNLHALRAILSRSGGGYLRLGPAETVDNELDWLTLPRGQGRTDAFLAPAEVEQALGRLTELEAAPRPAPAADPAGGRVSPALVLGGLLGAAGLGLGGYGLYRWWQGRKREQAPPARVKEAMDAAALPPAAGPARAAADAAAAGGDADERPRPRVGAVPGAPGAAAVKAGAAGRLGALVGAVPGPARPYNDRTDPPPEPVTKEACDGGELHRRLRAGDDDGDLHDAGDAVLRAGRAGGDAAGAGAHLERLLAAAGGAGGAAKQAAQAGAAAAVRPLTAADLPAAQALAKAAFAEPPDLAALLRTGRGLVCEKQGALAGYVAFGPGEAGGSCVHSLAVAKEARGQGVASALLDAVPGRVELAVRPDNGPARALYEKLGFAAAGERHGRLWLVKEAQEAQDKEAAWTFVPRPALDQIRAEGLLSGERLLDRPDLVALIAKGRGHDPAEFTPQFQDDVRKKLEGFKPEAARGPNVVWRKPPPETPLAANHPLRTHDLAAVRVRLARLLREVPGTRVHGLELSPYDSAGGDDQADRRHRDLGPAEIERFRRTAARRLWSKYSDPEGSGMYAPDVPHAAVLTPDGRIPPEYLVLPKEAGRPPPLRSVWERLAFVARV